jgi:cytochrome c oxidase subunit 3
MTDGGSGDLAPAIPGPQIAAARFGMWVFLSSEILLFSGLFALYAAARVAAPESFYEGASRMNEGLGLLNTLVLLTSSLTAVLAARSLEMQRRRLARTLVFLTVTLGLAFLLIKGAEYRAHFREGMFFGVGAMRSESAGLRSFVSLYYATTGLHALHVIGGSALLGWCFWRLGRRAGGGLPPHVLELATLYWHLVDVMWVFIWPLFYLGRAVTK